MLTAQITTGPGEPIASGEFLSGLRRSRLLTEDQLEALRNRPAGQDLDTLAADLVGGGSLTPYQFRRILDGEPQGMVLGPYVIIDELGEGGFGKVYKAVHNVMQRVVALKVIAPACAEDPESRELFLREVVRTTRLEHPNLALAYDANREGDILYLAMEYVDGPNLARYVSVRGPMHLLMACEVMLQVARALQYTHEKGVVHRDLKPANILLAGVPLHPDPEAGESRDGPLHAKVIDFGLARLYLGGGSSSSSIVQGGQLIGTPEFMAPEQARDFHQVDIRSDLYSLGCTFYFALTGRFPFRGRTPMQTIMQQINQEPVPVSDLRPDLPPEVAGIVHRLMAKDPAQRFQTPAELALALRRVLRDRQEEGRSPSPLTRRPPSLTRQRRVASLRDTIHDTGGEAACANVPTTKKIVDPRGPKAEVRLPEPAPAPAEGDVGLLWQSWQAVVAACAGGAVTSGDGREYQSLHRTLLEALRRQAALPSPQAPLYARLEALVEPWLTFRSLAELDRQSQARLWAECQQLDSRLPHSLRNGRRGWSAGTWLLAGVVVGCLGVLSVLAGLAL